MNGIGEMEYSNGDRFYGEFKDNQRVGKGSY